MVDDEQIILLDEKLQQIGVAPKLASHHADTPLHLAFSCFIFNNEGDFLLTQRARTKKVWPGVWTTSVCGHPAPHESMADAIKRRLDYELGLTAEQFQLVLPDYRYKTPPFKGVIENEYCPVYIAKATSDPAKNDQEVEDYRWVKWQDLKNQIASEPGNFSYWFKDQVQQLENKYNVDSPFYLFQQ